MLQKTADEFHGRQGHGPPPAYPLLLAFSGLLVSKSHLTVLDRENAVVGDRDPVDITGQILQDLVCALDTGLAIDHPAFFPDLFRECYTWQSVLSHFQELGPKNRRESLDRDKEFPVGRNPKLAIRRDAAAGNQKMAMRMICLCVGPGVEHRQHADLAAYICLDRPQVS